MSETPVNRRRRGMSLKLKLSIGLILIIGILFSGLNAFNLLTARNRQRTEAIIQNETVTRLVVAALTPELTNDDIRSSRIRTFIRNFLANALSSKRNRDLAFVVVVDTENNVIAGKAKADITIFPGNGRFPEESAALEEVARLKGNLGGDMRVQSFGLVVNGKPNGRLYVGSSLARINQQAKRDLLINLAVFVGALVTMMFYASFMLGRLVVRPLVQVADAMHDVQEGKLDTEVQIKRTDEIGVLADTYNFMVKGLREREQLKDAFSRYVSKQVYERFRAGEINLKGETRQATVLFSDIRSFTNLSEQLTPIEVVAMLNEYFTEMVEIVFKYDGFLNKFIGDAIMAIYNVPIDQAEPELRAVKTALEMVEALDRLNERRVARGQFAIKIGIGINTGPVVAGNLGHERRLEYTVIGDAVNLAQRIESQTKVTGTPVLISEATYRPCADHLDVIELPPVKVKGKQEPVVLYSVTGVRGSTPEVRRSTQQLQEVEAELVEEIVSPPRPVE